MKKPSQQSLIGLTALVFFIADIRDGVGLFLSIYLRSQLHWDSEKIGIALASTSLAAVLLQIPSGLLVDAIKSKRSVIAFACLLIISGCLSIVFFANFYSVIISQFLMGISSALIPAATGAITLGLVGRNYFPKRISINETFNHLGNFFTALATGLLGQFLGHPWILYTACSFAIFSLLSLLLIRPQEIDYKVAREQNEDPKTNPEPLLKVICRPAILIFSCSVILFHLANAAQLPLVGQLLAKNNPNSDALFMAGSIILAQLVMVAVAYSVGLIIDQFGRKPIFLVAFIVLPIRALLYTLTVNPTLLLAIQLLDGIGAGIFGVIAIVIVSDLAKGTGRFNFAQGLVSFCTAIGAALSNLLAGSVVKHFGFDAGFLTLASLALFGLLFFLLLMPETKNSKSVKNHP